MANRSKSILKRQKERTRAERKQMKLERRAQRSAERKLGPAAGAGNAEIGGIELLSPVLVDGSPVSTPLEMDSDPS